MQCRDVSPGRTQIRPSVHFAARVPQPMLPSAIGLPALQSTARGDDVTLLAES